MAIYGRPPESMQRKIKQAQLAIKCKSLEIESMFELEYYCIIYVTVTVLSVISKSVCLSVVVAITSLSRIG